MQKVVIYLATGGDYGVVNVPDSYMSGELRPAPHSSDRYYPNKASAMADAKARDGCHAIVLDESESN